MADMSLGLATAPILYAAENAPEIKKIVKRRFKKEVRCLRFVLVDHRVLACLCVVSSCVMLSLFQRRCTSPERLASHGRCGSVC